MQAVVVAAAAIAAAPAQAQDVAAGRARAQPCVVCHGLLGVSSLPDTPHLAGQPAVYVAAQLKAYRGGTRKHEVMAVIAKPLTDEDIGVLAAWYSSLRIEVKAP